MFQPPTEIPQIGPALGVVVEQDRGSLPFALIHGESLVACAAWALGAADVQAVDLDRAWEDIAAAEQTYVLHDALCPMTPPGFIAECVLRSQDEGAVVVGVRPVTDTVKQVSDGQVGATVDRDALMAVTSPVVLPPEVIGSWSDPPVTDFVALVRDLRAAGHPVVLLEAPPAGGRVGSTEDVRVLEALTATEGDPTLGR